MKFYFDTILGGPPQSEGRVVRGLRFFAVVTVLFGLALVQACIAWFFESGPEKYFRAFSLLPFAAILFCFAFGLWNRKAYTWPLGFAVIFLFVSEWWFIAVRGMSRGGSILEDNNWKYHGTVVAVFFTITSIRWTVEWYRKREVFSGPTSTTQSSEKSAAPFDDI